jgi:hypothetical protein
MHNRKCDQVLVLSLRIAILGGSRFWTRHPDGWKRHVFQNAYVDANADRCAIEAFGARW